MAFAAMGDTTRAWELFTLINPVRPCRHDRGLASYKVEPYVVAADVYGVAPHAAAAAGPGTPARLAGCTA